MSIVSQSALIVILAALSALAQIAFRAILPEPWSNINVFQITAALILLGWGWRGIIWLAPVVGFIFEILGAVRLGAVIVPLCVGMAAVILVYERIFTNRSWYSAAALTAVGILSVRVINALFSVKFNVLFSAAHGFALLGSIGWELLLSSALAAIMAFLLSRFSPRFERKAKSIIG